MEVKSQKNRWAELERHYDEAIRNLKDKAKKEVDWLEKQIKIAKELYKISPEKYYQHLKLRWRILIRTWINSERNFSQR